jgi:hypothetical protein
MGWFWVAVLSVIFIAPIVLCAVFMRQEVPKGEIEESSESLAMGYHVLSGQLERLKDRLYATLRREYLGGKIARTELDEAIEDYNLEEVAQQYRKLGE